MPINNDLRYIRRIGMSVLTRLRTDRCVIIIIIHVRRWPWWWYSTAVDAGEPVQCAVFFFLLFAFHRLSHSATAPNPSGGNQLNTRHRTVTANIRPEHFANASSTRTVRNGITRTRRRWSLLDTFRIVYFSARIELLLINERVISSVVLSDRLFTQRVFRFVVTFANFIFSSIVRRTAIYTPSTTPESTGTYTNIQY